MKKNKKLLIVIIVLVFLLTGCTKQFKDAEGKVVQDETTKQTLVENILCQPEELRDVYEDAIKKDAMDKNDIEDMKSKREKLQEKENDYKYYNTILKAINGDKKSKKEVLEHVEKKSLKRDLAIFTGTGVAGIALSAATGPAGLLLCLSSFFTTNHINNYIVDKKTNPKQKQEVINEIKKIEEDISKINQKISSIQFKISELE